MKLKIDKEFKSLIPPLTAEEYGLLEESIISEGVRDSLITWNGILIDGHNRHEICIKNKLPFKTIAKRFSNREDVSVWIILNQFGRRNLPIYERGLLALKLEESYAKQAKENLRLSRGKGKGLPDGVKVIPINTQKELERVSGIGHNTIHKIKSIQEKASKVTKEKLLKGKISVNRAYEEVKRIDLQEKYIAESKSPKKLSGKFRILYSDNPWKYGSHNGRARTRTVADDHYSTMSIEELCELPVESIAEKNAVLFMWVTSPFLEESFQVINAWGFKYKSSFVWHKNNHVIGNYNSVRHEFLLICTRGSCTPDNNKLIESVQFVKRSGKHSEKPEEFRKIIDSLYTYGKRIELFGRKKAKGWEVWGNQVS